MLDKNQVVIAQTTVTNAAHLAVALASKVFGNSLSDQVGGVSLTCSTIASVVVGNIRAKFSIQGVNHAQ